MSPKRFGSRSTKCSSAPPPSPPVARVGGSVLRSITVGALPMVNELLRRMRLQEFLRDVFPKEDGRTKRSPAKALLVLLHNLLVSREPIDGLGEWAVRYAPDLLDLTEKEIGLLNDDRVGWALDKLFAADVASLVLRVVAHVVNEFGLRLDELHNDSTTVSFFGTYLNAALEKQVLGRPTLAITFGHSKDHRPDLKQLLFILTVTAAGGVPLHFRAASGNVTDDVTHRDAWDLLCQLTGRHDFLYVADSKLATPREHGLPPPTSGAVHYGGGTGGFRPACPICRGSGITRATQYKVVKSEFRVELRDEPRLLIDGKSVFPTGS